MREPANNPVAHRPKEGKVMMQRRSTAGERERYAAQSLVRMYIKVVCWESALCVLPEKT